MGRAVSAVLYARVSDEVHGAIKRVADESGASMAYVIDTLLRRAMSLGGDELEAAIRRIRAENGHKDCPYCKGWPAPAATP